MMNCSEYTLKVLSEFKRLFPDNWILQSYDWDKKEDCFQYLFNAENRIDEFRACVFVNMSKLVLSGAFLNHDDSKYLSDFNDLIFDEFFPAQNKIIDRIQYAYSALIEDVKDCIALVRGHIQNVISHFNHQETLLTAYDYKKDRENRHELVSLLEEVCEVCWSEYKLSYSHSFTKNLLIGRQLMLLKKFSNNDVKNIIDISILKIELMLYKLQPFTDNKELTYSYNFEHIKLDPLKNENGKIKEFTEHFHDFIDPARMDSQKISDLLNDSNKECVGMWKLALLMRYYSKCSFSNDSRVNNLLKLGEKHYRESVISDVNIVDKYANRTFINYLYNSRFSYFCAKSKGYTFDNMKSDLYEIERIQQETNIKTYHPYQKAFDFLFKMINDKIDHFTGDEDLNGYFTFLEKCYENFKNNVSWSKKNQPYILQLRFKYSTVNDEKRGITYFCPSSFIRPLRFKLLDEKVVDYSAKVNMLKNRLVFLKDKRQLIEIENKIKSVESRSFERMAFFSTVIIFLVGLVSIFAGNSKDVSIINKMQYVSALGVILLLFLCLSYFITSKSLGKFKPFLFGGLLILFLLYLLYVCSTTW